MTFLQSARSIRPFIGAKDFNVSRAFYRKLGFEEKILNDQLCLFQRGETRFYLQRAYVQDWVDNTMVFIEVENVDECWEQLKSLNLTDEFPSSRITAPRALDWGKECFVHDPSGILWHFGQFS